MPSPFPGMDPYLEDPAIWPDFHDRFANDISVILNGLLPPAYYARLESRPEVGVVDSAGERRIVPDVSVFLHRSPPIVPAGSAAVADARAAPSLSYRVKVPDERIRHHFVEIRDSQSGHSLVTLIEIISPSNKRAGVDRKAYLKKQREVLGSDTGLIEIDLHSAGKSVIAAPVPNASWRHSRGAARYVVCVSRSWERRADAEFEIYPFSLTDPLPCIGIPLRQGQEEPNLDLQHVFDRSYDGSPYRRGMIAYDQPPSIPMTGSEKAWVRERVAAYLPTPEAGS